MPEKAPGETARKGADCARSTESGLGCEAKGAGGERRIGCNAGEKARPAKGPGGPGAWRTGREAEDGAKKFLEAKGFTVIGRNLRLGRGELDLVAWDGDTLVFVEVKARSGGSIGNALEAVDAAKQKRLISAAEDYLSRLAQPWPPCRFDVVAMTQGGKKGRHVAHLEDAFRPGAW